MLRTISTLTCLLVALFAQAQNNRVDTIPFTINNLLLVFKGSINGVPTEFAFDTGASSSVTNSTSNALCGIKVKAGNKNIRDANQNVTALQTVVMNDMAVGSYHVRNMKAVTTDMPYLYCANLVLLGQDFIQKFNWKIDFEQQLLYISSTPFTAAATAQVWKPVFKGNRPFIDVALSNRAARSCLIDFGFSGIFDLKLSDTEGQELLAGKKNNAQVNQYLTANMGLNGYGNTIEKNDFLLDVVRMCGYSFQQVMVTMRAAAETKLGVQFFQSYARCFILNHTEATYYLEPLLQPVPALHMPDARFALKDGHITVFDKNTGPASTAALLQIGEEIKSINGQTAASFTSNCGFLLWMYHYKEPELKVEKMNGQQLLIKRSSVF